MLLKLCLMWLTAFYCNTLDVINIARNKRTKASSTHPAFTSASAAVDGRIPGGDITEFMTCIHTSEKPRDENPWWEVDLGRMYPVVYITINARPGYVKRMLDTTVTIDNQTCFVISDIPTTNSVNLSCNTTLTGRIVRITRNSRYRNDISLNICEVRVWVCSHGKYSARCDQTCGHCKDATCDKARGRCPRGCDPGWEGESCHTGCRDGKYGWYCSKSCGHCANSSCDKVTGRCPKGCQAGWNGDTCHKGCEDGEYGLSCLQSCGHCAVLSCDKVSGKCPKGCTAGWKDTLCQTEGTELTVAVIE